MAAMRRVPANFTRLLGVVLALGLSLGAPLCASAAMDGIGSSPDCCAWDDRAGDRNAPESDVGPDLSTCLGACPGSALAQSGTIHADVTLPRAPTPPDESNAGRSFAPDPPPPRRLSVA